MLKNRVSAFILDMLLVLVLTVLMANIGAVNPYLEKYNKANKEYRAVYVQVMEDLQDNKIDTVIASQEILKYQRKVEKYNVFFNIWYLVFYLSYNVLFQFFNNGQTLGKKMFKIKVASKDGKEASLASMLVRTLFNGTSILSGVALFMIIKSAAVLITDKDIYLIVFTLSSLLSYVYEFLTLIFLLTKKGSRTLNDMIAKTQIVEV